MEITATYYENSDKCFVFINGYALVEQSISIAHKLAKEAGQKSFILTTFNKESSIPTRTTIEV